MTEERDAEDTAPTLPSALPILPVRGMVLFPMAVAPVLVGQNRSLQLIDDVMKGDRLIAVVCQKNPQAAPAGPDDLYRVGTAAVILQLRRSGDGSVQLIIQGLERIRITGFSQTDPYLIGTIDRAKEPDETGLEVEGVARSVRDLFRRFLSMMPDIPDEVGRGVELMEDVRQVASLVAAALPIENVVKQELLELDSVAAKLRRLVDILQHEIAVRELGRKIATETEETMTKAQREYYLREQMKAIQRELGDEDGERTGIRELREQLDRAQLPPEARGEAERELARLERTPAASPEHGIIRTYLEWMVHLPWNRVTGETIDVERARKVLDEDHHDLEKIKERILEYLSVRKLRQERGLEKPEDGPREPILCFIGPPGVGKTSLGQSIARAMGRRFVRISLGGVHDEAEIRGHRRTYIGAMPGRIIQALRRGETSDPVFMLDEVDKLGVGIQGDPSAALLEVLDPAQNMTFMDTYLNVPFDLSRVLFICTANTETTIPPPLLDRMELLRLSGYTEEEKLHIARRFLLKRQVAAHGLREDELTLDDTVIRNMIRGYTREAGVRNLERTLATLCRKVAREIAEHRRDRVTVEPAALETFLGPPKHFSETVERIDRPGVATGLAWTPTGGDLLFIEAAVYPGKQNRLILTGSLGDVMRESAQAALSFVRSRAESLGVDPTSFDDKDVHIHVPSGAIPKDGPSAGVTMTTALASAMSGRPVRPDLAMTGEITLRGKVLPVGGIKEKVLAAHRAGIRTIILPKGNVRDLDEIPESLRREMEFIGVDTISEVIQRALG